MVAEFVAHADDWDENMGMIRVKQEITLETARFQVSCNACSWRWPLEAIGSKESCPRCGSLVIMAMRNPKFAESLPDGEDPQWDHEHPPEPRLEEPDYNLL